MPELVQAPGLETADGWSFFPDGSANASRSTLDPYAGLWHGEIQRVADPLVFGGFRNGEAQADLLPANAGDAVNLALYVKHTGGAGVRVDYDAGDGIRSTLANIIIPTVAYLLWEPGGFTVIGPGAPRIWLTTSGGTAGAVRFDEVHGASVAGANLMARMFAEFTHKALLARLQAQLNAEIDLIELERNDGLVLRGIDTWFGYAREVVSPELVECEVVDGGIVFPRWNRDLSPMVNSGARVVLHCTVGAVIAVNHANRDGLTAGQMKERSWRYACAAIRVLANDPTLGYRDQISVSLDRDDVGAAVRYDARMARGMDGGMKTVDRVEVHCVINLQETVVGEGVLGGGVPPPAILEPVA